MRVIVVANAKGGVGKSFIASNLAHSLANDGKSVVLVDLDPHVPTVDLYCPEAPLGGLWSTGDAKPRLHAASERLSVLVAGPTALSTSDGEDRLSTDWKALNSSADFVVVDLGPGLSGLNRSVLAVADQVLLVLTPEPASLLGALRTSRAVFAEKPKAEIAFVVNKAATKASANKVGARFIESTGRFLSQEASFWGYVPWDRQAVECDAKRLVLIDAHPKSGTAKRFAAITSRLVRFQGFVDETMVVASLRKSQAEPEKMAA